MSSAGLTTVRKIDTIIPDVVIEEQSTSELAITQHPVELGAAITDHAFANPQLVVLQCGWSNSGKQANGNPNFVRDIETALKKLQLSRRPITIVGRSQTYENMLLHIVSVRTDQSSAWALFATLTCQQLILVQTQTTTVPSAANQKQPKATAPVKNSGTRQLTSTNDLQLNTEIAKQVQASQ